MPFLKRKKITSKEIREFLINDSYEQQTPNNLTKHVLLLNKGYQAIGTILVRDAINVVYKGAAEILKIENGVYNLYGFQEWVEASKDVVDDCVHGVRFNLFIPEIVRLIDYNHLPRRNVRLTKRNLYARDGCKCQYCGVKFPISKLSIDHVLPRSRGGKDEWENMATACVPCNMKKDNKTPKEAGMNLLREPKKPSDGKIIRTKSDHPTWDLFLN